MKICLSSDLAERIRDDVMHLAPDAELLTIDLEGELRGTPGEVEVLLFSVDISLAPPAMREVAQVMTDPALRWVQSPGAGTDHPIWATLLERGVRVSSAAGIHAEPIAQYIFSYVLHWERNVAAHLAHQRERSWEPIVSDDLTSKTLGIVGLGGIGLAAARIAKAFGMRVVATRRTPGTEPDVDELLPPERLHELLAASDYVVLCLPLNDRTRGLFGAPEIDAMRSDAVLINVARGGVADEPALIDALRAERIRGATLDVVSEEPLPPESLLWTLPNVVLTPHDAGYSPRAGERLSALFVENLGHYLEGRPLRNEVTDASG